MFSVLRRKNSYSPGEVSWLGGCESEIRCPLHLPQRCALSGIRSERPHSQWRNRAGFAPDFPVMPVIGTQREHCCNTVVRAASTHRRVPVSTFDASLDTIWDRLVECRTLRRFA